MTEEKAKRARALLGNIADFEKEIFNLINNGNVRALVGKDGYITPDEPEFAEILAIIQRKADKEYAEIKAELEAL